MKIWHYFERKKQVIIKTGKKNSKPDTHVLVGHACFREPDPHVLKTGTACFSSARLLKSIRRLPDDLGSCRLSGAVLVSRLHKDIVLVKTNERLIFDTFKLPCQFHSRLTV